MDRGKSGFLGLSLIACLAGGMISADETLLVPGGSGQGQVHRAGDRVEVKWPYGTVTMPAQSLPKEKPAAPAKPIHPRAWTHAVFNLRYELVRDGEFLKAQKVRVTVKNTTSFSTDSPA